MNILEKSRALQQGTTTSMQLIAQALARATDPHGEGERALTRLYEGTAKAEAQASDLLRAAGLTRSPVDGLPISIKDLFDVAGETTLAGSVVLDTEPPAQASAAIVRRLRAAGAVIVGRTNMTEFAFSGLGINPHYGTPRNPWDRNDGGRIPGGSSSGAAVSVADDMAIGAIGTDTGGSVRIPAALCGLTGFKPTARRVPMDGVLPLSRQLDSVGPIAKSVRCCAVLDAILSGEAAPLPQPTSLRGARLAMPTTVVLDGLDAHVAAAFSGALSKLSGAGARVEEIDLPPIAQLASINAKGGFSAAEAWAWHRPHIERAASRYDPHVLSRILRGRDMTAADLLDVIAARSAWIASTESLLTGFDAMLLPTVPIVAPKIADLAASDDAYFAANGLMLRNPSVINFLDGCALSVPCHAPGTAPAGLMIAGIGGSDRRILALGMAVEDALGVVQ
jgi:aspartyl-tRNA(Asn)/glutamyl-tRNA(Gln) amidotransferase subunit A